MGYIWHSMVMNCLKKLFSIEMEIDWY